eukprot:1189096-Prorocentrum_minimum.AAC.1
MALGAHISRDSLVHWDQRVAPMRVLDDTLCLAHRDRRDSPSRARLAPSGCHRSPLQPPRAHVAVGLHHRLPVKPRLVLMARPLSPTVLGVRAVAHQVPHHHAHCARGARSTAPCPWKPPPPSPPPQAPGSAECPLRPCAPPPSLPPPPPPPPRPGPPPASAPATGWAARAAGSRASGGGG